MPELSQRTALPLSDAAARLGISANALRMRIARGRAEGVRREGRLYVYVDAPADMPAAERAHDDASVEIDTVLELQKTELNRLLAENRRLNERLDNLVGLIQEEQASRRALQELFGEIASRGTAAGVPALHARLASIERGNRALRNAVVQMAESFERGSRATVHAEMDRRLRALEMDAATARMTLAEIGRHLRTKRRRSQT